MLQKRYIAEECDARKADSSHIGWLKMLTLSPRLLTISQEYHSVKQ